MDTTPTLHDFVFTLLTDSAAKSAFDLDPQGALADAGLGDLTPADVTDVLPLVADTLPVGGLPQLDSVTGLAGADLLPVQPGDVVGQVTGITDTVIGGASNTSADINLATVGSLTIDPTGVGIATGGVLPGLGVTAGLAGGAGVTLAPVHDVATTLDADVADITSYTTETVDTVGTVNVPVAGGGVEGVLGVTDTVTHQVGLTTDLVGGLDVPLLGDTDLPTHNLPVVGDTVDSVLNDPTEAIGGTLHGVGVGDVLGGVTGGVSGHAGVAGAEAQADAHADSHGLLGGATDILF